MVTIQNVVVSKVRTIDSLFILTARSHRSISHPREYTNGRVLGYELHKFPNNIPMKDIMRMHRLQRCNFMLFRINCLSSQLIIGTFLMRTRQCETQRYGLI